MSVSAGKLKRVRVDQGPLYIAEDENDNLLVSSEFFARGGVVISVDRARIQTFRQNLSVEEKAKIRKLTKDMKLRVIRVPDLAALFIQGDAAQRLRDDVASCIGRSDMISKRIEQFDKFAAAWLDDETFDHYAFIVDSPPIE